MSRPWPARRYRHPCNLTRPTTNRSRRNRKWRFTKALEWSGYAKLEQHGKYVHENLRLLLKRDILNICCRISRTFGKLHTTLIWNSEVYRKKCVSRLLWWMRLNRKLRRAIRINTFARTKSTGVCLDDTNNIARWFHNFSNCNEDIKILKSIYDKKFGNIDRSKKSCVVCTNTKSVMKIMFLYKTSWYSCKSKSDKSSQY